MVLHPGALGAAGVRRLRGQEGGGEELRQRHLESGERGDCGAGHTMCAHIKNTFHGFTIGTKKYSCKTLSGMRIFSLFGNFFFFLSKNPNFQKWCHHT